MKKSFNEVFYSLKTQYEKKEKSSREMQAYELLKKMIKKFGYNNVCDKISLNKQNNKNNALGAFIDDIKNSLSLELLCSQLFYLDDSSLYKSGNDKDQLNVGINNVKGKENFVLFKSEKKEVEESKNELKKEINCNK